MGRRRLHTKTRQDGSERLATAQLHTRPRRLLGGHRRWWFRFMLLLRRSHKGCAQDQDNSSNGKAGKTNCRGAQTMSQGRVKIFSLLHHDERRFRSLYSNIDPWSKKKCKNFGKTDDFLHLIIESVRKNLTWLCKNYAVQPND